MEFLDIIYIYVNLTPLRLSRELLYGDILD